MSSIDGCMLLCVYVCVRESHVQSVEAQVTDLQQSITHLQQERTELFSKVSRIYAVTI